jgi:hypothetical protein
MLLVYVETSLNIDGFGSQVEELIRNHDYDEGIGASWANLWTDGDIRLGHWILNICRWRRDIREGMGLKSTR